MLTPTAFPESDESAVFGSGQRNLSGVRAGHKCLRDRKIGTKKTHLSSDDSENGEGGIRTPGTGVYPYDGLANRCLKPLGHLSKHFNIIHL